MNLEREGTDGRTEKDHTHSRELDGTQEKRVLLIDSELTEEKKKRQHTQEFYKEVAGMMLQARKLSKFEKSM